MSIEKVRSALVEAFTEGNFFTSENIAGENQKFTPGTQPWAKLFFSPSQPTVATLGLGGQDRWDGFLQIDLNYPTDEGTADIGAKALAIINTFTAGKRFAYSGQEVVIANCGRSQGRISNGYYKVAITVVFYAHITR